SYFCSVPLTGPKKKVIFFHSFVKKHSRCQPRVVGPLQPVVATLGDDVVIQCHLKPSLDVEAETVEWSRPDLEPDLSDRLSRIEYVHVHRDHGEFVDMKMAAYVGRTMMFVEEMKHGNISLKIVNVTMTDQGVYRCYVPKCVLWTLLI
uniref:Ig-like domain-containing protein n=1 Tax=Mola mola TaxID=94237 RepID=A0A3Q4BAR2_MOLML